MADLDRTLGAVGNMSRQGFGVDVVVLLQKKNLILAGVGKGPILVDDQQRINYRERDEKVPERSQVNGCKQVKDGE